MKYYFTSMLSLAVLIFAAVSLASCGEDEPSAPAEESQLLDISGSWQLESATLGTESWNDEFDGAILALSGIYSEGGTYSFSFIVSPWPDNSPWPDGGSWKFKGTSGSDLTTKIIRLDDGLEMNYTLSGDQLSISFDYSGDGFPDGKVSSVDGSWTFVFTR